MPAVRDALILHVLLGAAGWVLWGHGVPAELFGPVLLALVVVYNLLLPWLMRRGGHGDWFDLWTFLLPLSAFLLLPTWLLAVQSGTLALSDHGLPRIGAVPVWMLGFWVIPLFPVVAFAGRSTSTALLASLLVFGALEFFAPHLHLWHPERVSTHYGIADYVLLPEALLGAAAAYAWTHSSGLLPRLVAAALVATLHTGALVLGLFVGEHLIRF